jgi:TPR repeat protein
MGLFSNIFKAVKVNLKNFGKETRSYAFIDNSLDTRVLYSETVDNAQGHYDVYKASSRDAALKFLRGKTVKEERQYVVVETPEGNFGRDFIMIFNESTGSMIEFVERIALSNLVKSSTRCTKCGYVVVPSINLEATYNFQVKMWVSSEEIKSKGHGFYCQNCKTLWCSFCVPLDADKFLANSSLHCELCNKDLMYFVEYKKVNDSVSNNSSEPVDADTQFHLGGKYYAKNNYSEALKWWLKSAEQGHRQALYNVGILYDKGRGVKQDYAEAASWYLKAANAGDVDAQFSLGCMYFQGQGVNKDFTEALTWLSSAANQGHQKAHNAKLVVKAAIETGATVITT